MHALSVEEIEYISFEVADKVFEFEESLPAFSTRYPGVLESCLATPFASYDGQDLYPEFLDKAAILFYLMNNNHPFKNGNKRIAVTTLLVFLYLNNTWLDATPIDMYNFALTVAQSQMKDKDKTILMIKEFIRNHITTNENSSLVL